MSSLIEPTEINESTQMEGLTYEQAYKELEAIVAALELENSALDEALAQFERGQMLVRYCTGLLDNAELKIKRLQGDELFDFYLQS